MRTLPFVLIAALLLTSVARAGGPTFSQTPNEAFLRQLDTEQLHLLRDVIRGCQGAAPLRDDASPCVMMRTDEAVAKSGNPDLEVFHKALPMSERYDVTRSATVWQAWLLKP